MENTKTLVVFSLISSLYLVEGGPGYSHRPLYGNRVDGYDSVALAESPPSEPPASSAPQDHFEHTSPTMETQQPLPDNSTMTTQSMNLTTHRFQNLTMSTSETMPIMSLSSFPNITTDAIETTVAIVESSGQTGPPPEFGEPRAVNGCGVATPSIKSQFQNPSYPDLDTGPNVFEYSVIPQEGFCALRIEFIETILAGESIKGCSIDSIVILNSADGPTTPLCGLLQGYQLTVRAAPEQPVKIVVTSQSSGYLFSIVLTQINCSSIKPIEDYQSKDCGVKIPMVTFPGVSISKNSVVETKMIHPTWLLKSKKKTLKDLIDAPSIVPSSILQSAVLNRETNITIVQGTEREINEWPWQALLMVDNVPLCGGTIINVKWVVFAAQCFASSSTRGLWRVHLATHNILRVSGVVLNAQNEGVNKDIALVKLASNIEFDETIKPVCLPLLKTPPDTYAGKSGITTGWERTEDSVGSPVLREANVSIISNAKCRQQWNCAGEGAGGIIDNGMICAGGGDVGQCIGDIGGSLVVQEEDERWSLVGLTSFGLLRGCSVPGIATVFTRVTAFTDWIALNLAEA